MASASLRRPSSSRLRLASQCMERFALTRVRVRVRKPDVELDPPVAYSAATVERGAS